MSSNTLDLLGEELAAAISAKVLETVRREMHSTIKQNFVPCFSEKEAADLLKISEGKLAELRKAKEINFSYSIPPSKFAPDGSPLNGRAVYTPDDILNYLFRFKVENIKPKVSFEDVFGYLSAPKDSSVLNFKKKAA